MSEKFNKVVELSFPPNRYADLDAHIDDLQLLARRTGANIRIRSEELLTQQALADSSQELWGTPLYGEFAYSNVLQGLQNAIESKGRIINSRGMLHLTVPILGLQAGDAKLGRASMAVDSLLAEASGVLSGLISPFPLVAVRPSLYSPELAIVCQPPTKPLTARYANYKQLNMHTLQGTVGKGLDVISHAVGLPLPEDYKAKRRYEGPFIGRRQLLEELKARDFPSTQITVLEARVAKALSFQGQHGYAQDSGQVIVEAGQEPSRDLLEVGWDRIALESLGVIASTAKKRSQMMDFLKQLAAQT